MKKFLFLITSIILTIQVFGKEVTIEQAKQVAEKYLNNKQNSGLKSTSGIKLTDAGDIFNNHTFSTKSYFKSTSVQYRDIYVFNIGTNNIGFKAQLSQKKRQ